MIEIVDIEPEIVINHKCLLGEGPIWDTKLQAICWIDILNGEIHEYSPKNKAFNTIYTHQMIGAIAFCKNGGFIAALKDGFGYINRASGYIEMIADPEAHLPNNRFNDGKCDPLGRFWAGSMALQESPECGSLYAMEENLSITKKIENITISNGMAWDMKRGVFYYIDTPSLEVSGFDYDILTGSIINKRTVIKVPKAEGSPDGMTIDNEGMLWIAHWGGGQIVRWNPDNGKKLAQIRMPVPNVTSCTFGGSELDDLYITSAKEAVSKDGNMNESLAGSLFVIRKIGYKGLESYEFNK